MAAMLESLWQIPNNIHDYPFTMSDIQGLKLRYVPSKHTEAVEHPKRHRTPQCMWYCLYLP